MHTTVPLATIIRRPAVWWAALTTAFTALAFVVFGPELHTYFVGDDFEEIWKATGGTARSTFVGAGSNFRPLHLLTLRINWWMVGLDPLVYNISNVGLHVVDSVLVAALALLVARRVPSLHQFDHPRFGVIAGLFFLLGPMNSEPVVWIAARADLLVTGCCVASLIAWLRRPTPTLRWRAASLGCFVLALLSKESAVMVPVLVTIVEIARTSGPVGARVRTALRAASGHYLVVAVYVVARWVAISGRSNGYGLADVVGSPARWPLNVAALMVRSVAPGVPVHLWLVGVGAIVVGVTGAFVTRRYDWGWATCASCLPLGLVSVSLMVVSVLPNAGLGVSATTTQGERLAYLPSAFSALLCGGLLAHVVKLWPRTGSIGVIGALTASALTLMSINQRWVDSSDTSRTFVAAESAWSPDSRPILLNLPDSVRGAFADRNSLHSSLALVHGWRDPYRAAYVSTVECDEADEAVHLSTTGDRRSWEMRLDPGDRFVSLAGRDGFDVDGVSARLIDDRRMVVQLAPGVSPDRVWYFSEGELRPLVERR